MALDSFRPRCPRATRPIASAASSRFARSSSSAASFACIMALDSFRPRCPRATRPILADAALMSRYLREAAARRHAVWIAVASLFHRSRLAVSASLSRLLGSCPNWRPRAVVKAASSLLSPLYLHPAARATHQASAATPLALAVSPSRAVHTPGGATARTTPDESSLVSDTPARPIASGAATPESSTRLAATSADGQTTKPIESP